MQSFWGFAQLYDVTRYADDNGLPSRIVHDVDQDRNGYLWVAGNNGVYKFDGHQFHAYYAILNDTTGLRDNKINAIKAASDNRIWIGTPKGLHLMENDHIRYVDLDPKGNDAAHHIITIFEDSNRDIWVGTYDGFYRISAQDGSIENFSEHLLWNDNKRAVWGFSEDSNNNLWICRSDYPPLILPQGSNKFRELEVSREPDDLPKDHTYYNYLEFEPGHFLIESSHGLLHGIYDGRDSFVVDHFYDQEKNKLPMHHINKTIIDSDNSIWVATWRNYYRKYRYVEGALHEQEVIGMKDASDMSTYARSVFEDDQGNIWMPNSNGLFKFSNTSGRTGVFPPQHLPDCLENISIYSILEDKKGRLWINTPSHLYRIDKEDILKSRCPQNYLKYESRQFQLARDMMIDTEDRLWISGQGGISVTQLDDDHEPGPFVHYTEKDGLPHLWCFEMLQEDTNEFWGTNYNVLFHLSLENGDISRPEFKTYTSSDEREDALVNSYTLQLAKDRNDDLWIGTYFGVSKLVSESGDGRFRNYTSTFGKADHLSNNAIKKIFRDSKDRLWIATQTGLNLYIEETDSFKQFGRPEGLPSEYILGIAEDSKGQLWIPTTQGVFKGIYNTSMEEFVHIEYFTRKEGLADNITNRNAIYIDKKDRVFVGSSQGISILNNTEVNPKARRYNLGITTLKTTQESKSGFFPVMDRVSQNKIKLNHRENSLQLEYAVLDFTNPEYNQYRHKLLPLNNEWVQTGNSARLTYYNLSPGTYELLLDGHNNQGIWQEQPLKLTFTISPPFWRSWVAIVVYGVLGILFVRWLYHMRVRKRLRELEQQAKLESALVQEREQLRNDNAADFHDELGSKVTKISMFLTLAERNIESKDDLRPWFGKMRETIQDLSGSFRDLLWVIDPMKDSLGDAFLRLKDFGEELLATKDIRFSTLGFTEALTRVKLDPQTKKQVVLIFKEAIHNSVKYSECTSVELKIRPGKHASELELTDNGNGFNIETQGKGRGLTNMKRRSEKIGAQLMIRSGNKGTNITLSNIPHLSED